VCQAERLANKFAPTGIYGVLESCALCNRFVVFHETRKLAGLSGLRAANHFFIRR
jgi:hypothetical protein